jgi:hypothetical protein
VPRHPSLVPLASDVDGTPAGAQCLVLRGARDSRASGRTRGGATVGRAGFDILPLALGFDQQNVQPGITPMGAARGPCHGDRRPLGRRGWVAGLGPPAQLGGTLGPSGHTESSGSA